MKILKAIGSIFAGLLLGTSLFVATEGVAALKAVTGFSGGDIPIATGFPDGTANSPSIYWTSDNDGTGTGWYRRATGVFTFASNGLNAMELANNRMNMGSAIVLGWGSASTTVNSEDTSLARVAANSIIFGGGSAATTTSRTEMNKAVAAISNNVATSVLTITIPNAAHSASVQVRLTCSLGAGGAIGANEATASNTYLITITRTAGVNAAAAISSAFGAAASAVAGAATVTATAALSSVSGAVGATNTFDVNATVARSAGSSDNHTCLVYGVLMNANVTGITIS
jgi:hypothetical protein